MRPIDCHKAKKAIHDHGTNMLRKDTVLKILDSIPTLTPPNEWVRRVKELDELYTKLQIVTGFTAEQLLEMFAAGYTLKKPDYSKHFEAMANLAESDPPNEPLTPCDVCRFSPPSSGDGKPCCLCPADRRPPERQEDTP